MKKSATIGATRSRSGSESSPKTPSDHKNRRSSISQIKKTLTGMVRKKNSTASSAAVVSPVEHGNNKASAASMSPIGESGSVVAPPVSGRSFADDTSFYTTADVSTLEEPKYPVITTKDLEIQLLNLMDAIETRESHIVKGVDDALQQINTRLKKCEEQSSVIPDDSTVLFEINERLKRCEEALKMQNSS